MALMKKKFSEIPADAIILSEDEALEYQLKLIKGWKDSSDIWIFKHGVSILASLGALSSIYINNHYRVKLRLLDFGRMSSYLPVVALPAIACAVFHQQFVVRDVLLQKKCATCMEIRAAAYQSVLSTAFPAVLAVASALPFAIRYNTYDVPAITQQPRKVFELVWRHTRPAGNALAAVACAQAAAAALVTFQEMKSLAAIGGKLSALEARVEPAVVQ